MALRMMSAIVPGACNGSDANQMVDHASEREKLLADLLSAAKKCHIRFGGRVELATESDTCITQLCYAFEQIFDHGLLSNRNDKRNSALRHVSDFVSGNSSKPELTFWPCIKERLTWHEQERFTVLRKVCTDYGRGRAWLRAALNERSLERHLHSILCPETLAPFYKSWAFLLDQEKASVLPNIAAGLVSIVFAINVDNEELNDSCARNELARNKISQSEPIINAVIPENLDRDKMKRKVPTSIISFDDDDDREVSDIVSASAPPTCLSSPNVANKSSESPSLAEGSVAVDVNSLDLNDKIENWNTSELFEEEKLLTPLTDTGNLGGLVPVSPLGIAMEDSVISGPNYLDEVESAEPALEATEPVIASLPCDDTDKLDIDTLRVRLLATSEILEQAREDAIASRSQLVRFQRQHQNYVEKHDMQLQTLTRENELLRQQLRKYVTAVQMLRRNSDSTTVESEEEATLDYHREAQQYQHKLVQVAEMHAELMEFNARLTVQLTNKERLIKMLQSELECLRGPLNDDDLPSESPCMIHIWIPSAFLTGQSSDIHHVYQIYIRIRDTEWNIYRRYAQFYTLYRELKKHDNIVTTFEFPPKKTIGNKDAKFVEERRLKLQQWLRRVVRRLAECSPAFSSHPSRQTLVTSMPFFSDQPTNEDTRRNNTTRNTTSSSPQYTGL